MSLRTVLFATLLTFAAVLVTTRCAWALEICPAYVGNFLQTSAPTTYAFDIDAQDARTVEGTVAVETDQGWFAVPFPQVQLKATTWHFRGSNGQSSSVDTFASPILLTVFPKPVKIRNYWVESAKAKGDSSGWEAKGNYQCEPGTLGRLSAPQTFVEEPNYTHLAPSAPAIVAVSVPPIENTDCARPFHEATIVSAAHPIVPLELQNDGVPLQAVIKVTIAPDGSVSEAEMYRSSGSALFDTPALVAARTTKYSPRVVYCKPVYGDYLLPEVFLPPG